jgi:hypothetical protein
MAFQPRVNRSRVNLSVVKTGPFWTHGRQIAQATEQAESKVADRARDHIKDRLGQVVKHRTGAYENAVKAERRGSVHVVTDSGVVYGPWLEAGRTRGPGGVPRTTRFKGYRSFLRAKNSAAKWLREQTQAAVAQALKGLN